MSLHSAFKFLFVAHFYLVRLLLTCMEKAGAGSSKARIVVVSSVAHKYGPKVIDYDGLQVSFMSNRR